MKRINQEKEKKQFRGDRQAQTPWRTWPTIA